MRLRAHHQHSQFWPILTRFVDYYSLFWGPEAISIVVEPQGALMSRSSTLAVLDDSGRFRGRLLVGHQHWQFLPILARFMDYYTLFWGPEAISIVVEPQGSLMCQSSTLAVWADSGPFLRLLLTILGSRSDSHSC